MESNQKHRRRHQRRPSQRFNPLGAAEIEEFDFSKDVVDEKFVDTTSIVDKLKSFDPQIREMATISLAQIENFSEEFIKFLYEKGTFQSLIERLVDPNPQIVLSSLLALTNIAESGSSVQDKNVGDIIIDKGVLILLESILSDFQNAHEKRLIDISSNDFGVKMAIVDQSYKLMSRLVEVVSEGYVDNFLQSKVTTTSLYFVMNCDEARILTGIGSYLQVLTEISVKICQHVNDNLDFLKRLVIISEANFATQELKAYIIGSLYNYICTLERNGIEPNGKNELLEKILAGVLSILDVRIFDEVSNLLKIYQDNQARQANGVSHQENGDTDPINHDEEANEDVPLTSNTAQNEDSLVDLRLKQAFGIWGDSASAIQICLGIIINLFESAEAFEEEWKDEDDDETQDEKTNTKLNKYEPSQTSFMVNMTQDLREKILANVVNKFQHLNDKAYADFLSNMRQVGDQCKKIVEFACPAILNILMNIEYTDKKNGAKYMDTIAEQLFKTCVEEWKYYLEVLYENNTGRDIEESDDREDMTFEQNIINDILKIMSHLIQTSSVNLVSLIDIKQFLEVQTNTFDLLSEESKQATIELAGTRCHPKYQISLEENALIADFLMRLLQSDNVMIIGEALNALFDVYSEEAYDEIFVQKGFMNVLDYGYNVFKKKIAENKGSLSAENYALLRNHLLNLRRFIKYKQEHVGK